MPRCRSRFAAAVLAFALLVAPLASAAPLAPGAESWWSLLAGFLDLFPDGTRTITAPTGPGLDPDGGKNAIVVGLPDDGSGDSLDKQVRDPAPCGSCMDPHGSS
jgi:hypothetical protein